MQRFIFPGRLDQRNAEPARRKSALDWLDCSEVKDDTPRNPTRVVSAADVDPPNKRSAWDVCELADRLRPDSRRHLDTPAPAAVALLGRPRMVYPFYRRFLPGLESDGLQRRRILAFVVGGRRGAVSWLRLPSCSRAVCIRSITRRAYSVGQSIWRIHDLGFDAAVPVAGIFSRRLMRILPRGNWAAIRAAIVFAVAHLPNPILTPMTLLWGLTACLVFLRFAQHLSARDRACHIRHLRRHHHPRASRAQHAGRARLSHYRAPHGIFT